MTAYPDADIAAMSFHFWHRLSHALVGRSSKKSVDGDSPEEKAERARRHQLFLPAYVHLMQNIMGRSFSSLQMPPLTINR